ncbi:hypothetical protein HVIM_03964 (plasmid) [Roseomonas mucosa]|nr:hypothetical protein HVIM_03964 [Roseomonas mucosa]
MAVPVVHHEDVAVTPATARQGSCARQVRVLRSEVVVLMLQRLRIVRPPEQHGGQGAAGGEDGEGQECRA